MIRTTCQVTLGSQDVAVCLKPAIDVTATDVIAAHLGLVLRPGLDHRPDRTRFSALGVPDETRQMFESPVARVVGVKALSLRALL